MTLDCVLKPKSSLSPFSRSSTMHVLASFSVRPIPRGSPVALQARARPHFGVGTSRPRHPRGAPGPCARALSTAGSSRFRSFHSHGEITPPCRVLASLRLTARSSITPCARHRAQQLQDMTFDDVTGERCVRLNA